MDRYSLTQANEALGGQALSVARGCVPDTPASAGTVVRSLMHDWFITRAKKLLFSLEYSQEYKDAAEALYRDTVGHVFQMIAEDLLNENPTWTRRLDDREDGSRHGHLQRWIRPELAEIYDKAEREELRKKRFKTGGFCQPNCCKEKCARAKAYDAG